MLFQKITYANRKILAHVNEVLKPYNLNSSDWRVFMYLNRHESSTLLPICEFYDMDKAILSRSVYKLEKLGFLEFLKAEDKREKHIKLSQKGEEVFTHNHTIIKKYEDEILLLLDKAYKDIFMDSLDIINNALTSKQQKEDK